MNKQSNSKKAWLEKLEKLFFFSIILFLPTQFGKHLWPHFSFIEGIRIDYLSPTIYLTDALIVLLLLTWGFLHLSKPRIRNQSFNFAQDKELGIRNKKPMIHNSKFIVPIALVLFLLISILLSQSSQAGLYKLIKLIEFTLFGFYLAVHTKLRKDLPTIAVLLSMGVIFEALLSLAQFTTQGSIGGIFWLFGERTFSGQTPGIANAVLDGSLILRPYGTFPHPNVLAGYLLVVMTVIIHDLRFKIYDLRKRLFMVALALGTISLLLTLSRVAIILWMLIVGYLFVKKFIIHHSSFIIRVLLLVLVLIGSIGIIYLTPLSSRFASLASTDRESLTRRYELNLAAIEMFKNSPLLGIGLNNFLIRLTDFQKPSPGPLWLQPAHNIYLLVLAETGIVGFVFSFWFIFKTYTRIKEKKSIIHYPLFIILVLGLFDHYFLTLQQGQLLLALVIGLAWARGR